MAASVSLSETQIFTALSAVLNGFGLLSATGVAVPVVRGLVNRVGEPVEPDFVVMWPSRRRRLSTNVDVLVDLIVQGSIASNILTVASVVSARSNVPLVAPVPAVVAPGQTVLTSAASGYGTIVRQLSGTPGGAGTYQTTPTADVASGLLYLGTRAMRTPTEVTVQCDVHGPASADNAQRMMTQTRDQVGVAAFAATGYDLAPLYADDPRQAAFVDAEVQYEERWIVDVCMQANIVVTVPQQFAGQLKVTAQPVESLRWTGPFPPVLDPFGNPVLDPSGNPVFGP